MKQFSFAPETLEFWLRIPVEARIIPVLMSCVFTDCSTDVSLLV
jgi:hypothetical protein